jgi:hypothetical protein
VKDFIFEGGPLAFIGGAITAVGLNGPVTSTMVLAAGLYRSVSIFRGTYICGK